MCANPEMTCLVVFLNLLFFFCVKQVDTPHHATHLMGGYESSQEVPFTPHTA